MMESLEDLPVILATLTQSIDALTKNLTRMEVNLIQRNKRQEEDIATNKAEIDLIAAEVNALKLTVVEVKAWQMSHDRFKCPFVGQPALNVVQVALEKLLVRHFSKDEMMSLAFELSVPDAVDDHQTKQMMAISLVLELSRANRLPHLLSALQRARPSVIWPKLFEENNNE